jgi:hypothetical protein
MASSGLRRSAVALLLCAMAGSASAQDFLPFGDLDERQEMLEPPFSLPESRNGTMWPRANAPRISQVTRISQVFQAIQACWKLPEGSGSSGQEITVRVSFRRDGTMISEPRMTFYKAGTEKNRREGFVRSVRAAFAQCEPLPFSEKFGAANAGIPFNFRFIDASPL